MFTVMSQRKWITPLVIDSFLLSAVTGVLMFFHLDVAWNKMAHTGKRCRIWWGPSSRRKCVCFTM
jgi:hypothetical protein